jgi:hypothetical protein
MEGARKRWCVDFEKLDQENKKNWSSKSSLSTYPAKMLARKSLEVRMISQSRCHAMVRRDVVISPHPHMTSGMADSPGLQKKKGCRHFPPDVGEGTNIDKR